MAFFSVRRLRRWLVLAGAVAAISLRPSAASADPALARKHFDLGKRYFQVEELRKAIDEFKAAHIEEPDPAFLYNIAECYRKLGEADEAIGFYRRYLSLTSQSAPMRSTAAQHITELEAARDATPAPAPPPPPAAVAVAPPPKLAAPPPSEPLPARAPAPALVTAAPPDDQAPQAAAHPFYKRAWFYGVVGAVLIGGAAGVWALSSSGGTTVPGTPLGNQTAFGR